MERYEGGKRMMRERAAGMMMTSMKGGMSVKMEEAGGGSDNEFEDEDFSMGADADEKKMKRVCGRRPVAAGGGAGGVGGGGLPCCQAERCSADLSEAKKYHRRHKVCEFHAKAPIVVVAGIHQRFCQQCSRFHELTEFDETKRSCRRRLAGHNERRRKSSSTEAQGGDNLSANRKGGAQCWPSEERAGRVQIGNSTANYKHFQIR